MVRTSVYLFVAIVPVGTVATPGLAAFALVVVPLFGLGTLWRIAMTVSTHGRPTDAVVHTRKSHLRLLRGANIPPPGLAETLAVRPRDENPIRGGGG
jgi:hypothetical protein